MTDMNQFTRGIILSLISFEWIKEHALDVNARLPCGLYPMTIAIRTKAISVGKILISLGASVELQEFEGHGKSIVLNAFDDAWMYQDNAALDFLGSSGVSMERE
jgi:hypothetical protein